METHPYSFPRPLSAGGKIQSVSPLGETRPRSRHHHTKKSISKILVRDTGFEPVTLPTSRECSTN